MLFMPVAVLWIFNDEKHEVFRIRILTQESFCGGISTLPYNACLDYGATL
jgi:hypothetical protein